MAPPKVRPLNPDHQRLIEELLANPATVICPICGQRGFWDNREGKKNPKSPDYKCKNKECPGATPLKGKNPYAVWLPEDFAQAPASSPTRIPSPYVGTEPVITPQSLKDDPQGRGEAWEPPEEGPYADAETEREAIEQRKHAARQAAAKRYLALWDVVAAHQVAKGKELDMPVDGMSVNAATATLWIYFGNKGML